MFRLGENEAFVQQEQTLSRHAMMVVGIVGDILLVQNWWRKAPFVQMSIDFLDTHEGKLSAALPIG